MLGCDTHFGVLEVPREADGSEIKKAHRRKAIILHPDKNKEPFCSEAFQRVQAAYEMLSDESKRKEYIETLEILEKRGSDKAGGGDPPPGAKGAAAANKAAAGKRPSGAQQRPRG